jgi:uncharacterized protein YciI
MIYILIGHFNAEVQDEHRAAVQAAFNEHLAQSSPRVKLAGPLKARDGNWVGHVIIVEADDFDQAQRYASRSPYHQAGLYERMEVERFDIVAGRLN